MTHVVGIRGDKGSGKSELAGALERLYGYRVVAFADPLKQAAARLFGLTHAQLHDARTKETVDSRWGVTPRVLFQRLGTEAGRRGNLGEFENLGVSAERVREALREVGVEPGEGCWVRAWEGRAKQEERVATPDVRFPDEGDAVRRLGGVIVLVERPGTGGDAHASETSARGIVPDLVILNTGPLSAFSSYARAAHRIASRRA